MKLLNWLDHRTGYRHFVHEALFERIPGGARWRYVWGSTLVFTFATQVITGIFLWMAYSPSAQTAWESVYFIQNEMQGGWLLRGLHHFTAQAMIVLLVLHLMQVVIDGAYRAPREVNFWIGLVLMLLVLGLSLTGYLLPWDQKGYWATRVATNLMSLGDRRLPVLVVGGADYGHHTLTRFFAVHAGVLPGLLMALLVLHVALFRRHGICHKLPVKRSDAFGRTRAQGAGPFWPCLQLCSSLLCA
jgi:ubiquinol-cytochrome c reductase cytochrome b subunit